MKRAVCLASIVFALAVVNSALVAAPADAADRRPSAAAPTASIAGPWSALGANGAGDGALNGKVDAMAVSGDDVYVGGSFTNAGGVPGANFIARWDGARWFRVGAPGAINDQVQAIAVAGSGIYIGGRFIDAGGVATADYVAKWNGSSWAALGSNPSGGGALRNWVQALDVNGTDVYVGGSFKNAAGVPQADYVAKWNGTTWSALGSDVGGTDGAIAPATVAPSPIVFALARSGTDLYVGGGFINVAGTAEADYVAKWNGSAWSALGSDFTNNGAIESPSVVYALAMSGTDLYVGGSFNDPPGISPDSDNVALWNGTAWSPLGTNLDQSDGAIQGSVDSLAVVGADVYVGGDFFDGGGLPAADRIARWDGSGWSALGSGGPDGGALNDFVGALTASPSGADLYAAGGFTDAASLGKADHVALWGPHVVVRHPDARVRVGTAAYAGDDVYNTTASGQARTGDAPAGHSVAFGISIQNDGSDADRIAVKGTGAASSAYTVRYFRGSTDVTGLIVAGTYRTSSLAPGHAATLTVKVTVASTAGAGSSVSRLVTAISVGDASRKDAVRFTAARS
jgi:hypothetical protein